MRRFLAFLRSKPPASTRKPGGPRRFRPLLDRLEDRTLPSTLTVVNGADSGPGSLRDRIAAASPGDTIVFAPSVHQVTLTSGPLAVAKGLDIEGPGANRLTVSGSGVTRIFNIGGGVAVTLAGLTLAHGSADAGGGIDNFGSLTVRDAVLADNQAAGGLGGGAIHNESGANLVLCRCALTDNSATAGPASDVFGGGLLNEGTAAVLSSVFTGNEALGGAGTAFAGSQGGAIDNFGSATLTVGDSAFLANRALGADGATFGAGGAVENNAGFDYGFDGNPGSSATLRNCLFAGNVAGGGTGSTGNGGAIDNEGLGTSVTVVGCTLLGNRSVGGPGGDGETALGQGIGGGLMNTYGSFTITDSAVLANQAVGGDHATPTADNPATGGGVGGGMANFLGGTLTVTRCTVQGNAALGGATDAGPGASGVGGGIDNSFSFPDFGLVSTLTVTDSRISNNVAAGGRGGPGSSTVPAGFGAGGGLDNSFHSVASLTNCTLQGNVAVGSAGGAGADGGTGLGGAISVGINLLFGFTDASTLELTNCSLVGNLAQGGRGGVGADGGSGLGGGLYVAAGSSASVVHGTIEFNLALGGAGGAGGGAGEGLGGGGRRSRA